MSPVVSRLMAVLAAVGMVLGALAVRDRLDGVRGDDQTITAPSTSPRPQADPDDPATVVCARDLRAVCEALASSSGLAVSYEPASTTADRLTSTEVVDLDAWVVLEPWPAIVDARRSRAGRSELFGSAVTTLASSPTVMVVAAERLPTLNAACGGAVTWACVGERADRPWSELGGQSSWGTPKPGHAAPGTAIGSVVTGQAVASQVGTTGFSTRDLSADPFRAWFTRLERAVPTFEPSAGSHLRQLLQFGPGSVDILGTIEAEPAELLPRVGARADVASVLYPEPIVLARLVVADLRGDVATALDDVEDVLAAAGWRTGTAPPAGLPDGPTLPGGDASGAPSAGAIEALQGTWAEVVR